MKIDFNITGKRLRGDLVKENHHTVWCWMWTGPDYGHRVIKRHKVKHNVKKVYK